MKQAAWRVGQLLCASLVLLSSGCSSESKKPEHQWPRVVGWQEFKLGMSFDEALAAVPAIRWNAYALSECEDDLAIKGCFLSQNEKEYAPIVDGIALAPSLSFNKFGKLTDITLGYDKSGGVTREQCLELTDRVFDRLIQEYGPFASSKSKGRKGDWPQETRKTGAGNSYVIGAEEGTDDWITNPARGQLEGDERLKARSITEWNNEAYVSIIAYYLGISKVHQCRISITYAAPPSVLRRDMDTD